MYFYVTAQDMINVLLVAIGIGVSFLCLLQLTVSNHIKKDVRRYFQIFFGTILLYICSHLAREIGENITGDSVRNFLYSVTFIELVSAGFMTMLLSLCVLGAAQIGAKETKLRLILLTMLVIHILIIVLGQINGFIFYFDENNEYHRSSLYVLSNLSPLLMLIFDGYLLIHYNKNIPPRIRTAFWIYIISPIVAMAVQTLVYGLQLIIFATVASAVYLFTVIIEQLNDTYAKQQLVTTRLSTELRMATDIQASQLPRLFPAYPSRMEFDLFASMTPAKEVGGDFYDFFLVDDDHIALVMADVSGKGVPAALFMMVSRVLIKSHLQNGESPEQTLRSVNDQLCEGNESHLFVTVWLGVLEISTGKGIAVNAGHEHPALRRAGDEFKLIIYRHSPAVATLRGIKYKQHEFELHHGDTLFVYTDGVAEATNKSNELMGTDRMLDALNKDADALPEKILSNVMDGINEFVANAEQFDDITMLCLKYYGPEGRDKKES